MATTAELEAEVALLREEVAALRAQVPTPVIRPSCTCGTTIICQAHPRPYPNVWVNGQWQGAANAGCAPPNVFTVLDAAGRTTYTYTLPATAAGCAGPPLHATQYFTLGT